MVLLQLLTSEPVGVNKVLSYIDSSYKMTGEKFFRVLEISRGLISMNVHR